MRYFLRNSVVGASVFLFALLFAPALMDSISSFVKISLVVKITFAKNVKSNIRDLEGSLNRVNAFSSLQKRELTLELAQEALKDTISTDGNKIVTVDHIVDIVAEHFNITQNDIYSNSRSRNVAYPRQIAMYLSKKLTTNSVTDIGKFLGNRDHAVVGGVDT